MKKITFLTIPYLAILFIFIVTCSALGHKAIAERQLKC